MVKRSPVSLPKRVLVNIAEHYVALFKRDLSVSMVPLLQTCKTIFEIVVPIFYRDIEIFHMNQQMLLDAGPGARFQDMIETITIIPPPEGRSWLSTKSPQDYTSFMLRDRSKDPGYFRDLDWEGETLRFIDGREYRSVAYGQLAPIWITYYRCANLVIAEQDWQEHPNYRIDYADLFKLCREHEVADFTIDLSAVIGRAFGVDRRRKPLDVVRRELQAFVRIVKKGVPRADEPITFLPRTHFVCQDRPYLLYRSGKLKRVCHGRVWLEAGQNCYGPISEEDLRLQEIFCFGDFDTEDKGIAEETDHDSLL